MSVRDLDKISGCLGWEKRTEITKVDGQVRGGIFETLLEIFENGNSNSASGRLQQSSKREGTRMEIS